MRLAYLRRLTPQQLDQRPHGPMAVLRPVSGRTIARVLEVREAHSMVAHSIADGTISSAAMVDRA
ncbi:hypothetical protein [Amycolatopsis sp. cmx-8-4]|uniref:hypothetical protein n=1 Tax=Amycolatopsis sp. cmx-8-4 TaxID=2790947 RepID=UPI00397B4308